MNTFKAGTSTQVVVTPNSEDDNGPITATIVEVDGEALANHAQALGAKASVFMGDTIERLSKAKEEWQGGPIFTLLALRDAYSEEELAEFAVPGTETGNNPDKFKITVMNGDKKTTRQTTFYAQFARGTAAGKKIAETLEFLDRAADKGAVKDDIPADILALDHEGRERQRSFLNGRINTMTQAYKRAMLLHFKFVEVEEYADNIYCDIDWVEGKSPDDVDHVSQCEVEPGNEPIILWMQEDGKDGKPGKQKREPFSIAAFLKLNPAKALEKGGGFKALIESGVVKKAPGGGATTPAGAASEDITIKTVNTGLGIMVEFHRWMQEIRGERDGTEIGKFLMELKKKNNDEYLVAAVELKNILIDVCRDTGADAAYAKLASNGSELIGVGSKAKKAA